MKWNLVATILLLVGVLAACGGDEEMVSDTLAEKQTSSEGQQITTTVTQGQTDDLKALVASYSSDKTTDEKASITSKQLIVTGKDGNETHYTLPENEFFVSIAPYITETHPCKDHSLTGCQGELVEQELEVVIENEKGEVIVDGMYTTLENGFIDFWLPRNEAFVIEMNYGDKKVLGEITTFDKDGTCVTTLQLM